MKRFQRQSGQAVIELTVMLLALTGMILALVILADVQFAGNSLLLSARSEAQQAALSADASQTESGQEYRDWSYAAFDPKYSPLSNSRGSNTHSTVIFRRKGRDYRLSSVADDSDDRLYQVAAPFSANAAASRNGEQETLAPSADSLGGAGYSQLNSSRWENYREWRSLSDFTGGQNSDFYPGLSGCNALNAAALIRASGTEEKRLLNGYQAGEHSADDALWVMRRSFAKLFGADPNNFDPGDDPVNQVAMPLAGQE